MVPVAGVWGATQLMPNTVFHTAFDAVLEAPFWYIVAFCTDKLAYVVLIRVVGDPECQS